MTSLLTITGATGTQGSAIINYFRKHEPQYRIRGLTRNTNSVKARELVQQGIEMVTADYDDLESLKKAFAGSDVIYAYTDFYSLVETSAAKELLESGKAESLTHAARFLAIQQGKNVADAAASVQGLKRIVWSTLADADNVSNGKWAGAYELENKAVILRYLRSLPELKDKVNALYLTIFLNAIVNFPTFFGWTKLSENEYTFRQPIRPDTKLPWTDMDVEAGRFVAALLRQRAGTDVNATTMHFSFEDLAAVLEKKHNVKVKVEQISADEYTSGDPTGYALNDYNMLGFMQDHGAVGDDKSILPPVDLVPHHAERRTLEDIDWKTLFEA